MRHALFFPPFGPLADPRRVVEIAVAAEDAGYDGVFLWDHMARFADERPEVADPWITLAAIATATSKVRIGPMITPLARRRPHKVARETVTLDQLSGGRLTLGVGLGVDTGGELRRFGEETDESRRADLLDEALDVLLALWTGEEVTHHGPHFEVDAVTFLPRPVQSPRIPVWCAARRSGTARTIRRASRVDGIFPVDATLDDLERLVAGVRAVRGSLDGYDVAVEVQPGQDLRRLGELGATWAIWMFRQTAPPEEVLAGASAGPAALAERWRVVGEC